MSASLYHSSTGTQAPHCMHVVGIGRTGAAYVEALLRTGEIEDQLTDPRATFSALVVDIGEQDMGIAEDYAKAFVKRLESRGIPTDRFLFQAVPLPVPSKDEFFEGMNRTREFLKLEYPRYYWNPNFESYVPKTYEMPKAGGHFPRAVAKGIYANAYYADERPLEKALRKFADQVDKSGLPSMITLCFSLAGGTGSGMVVDLARHLSNVKLGRRIPVIGVGQLPHSGDPEIYYNAPQLYTTLNEIDCMLDEDKNNGVIAVWGDLYRNPFTGGFFIVNPEQSWQRLTAYTTTGEAAIRQGFKEMVTNRFVADSFMRFVVSDNGRNLFRAMRPAGLTGAPHETVSAKARSWTMFDVAKLTHPGVQVLPGEAPSKWEGVVEQWTDFVPKYDGLKDEFRTDYAEVLIYGSRNMPIAKMETDFKKLIADEYLLDSESSMQISTNEFFDALTAYADIILAGVAKTDLDAFWASQKTYEGLTWEEKLNEHAWLIDIGPMLSEPAIRFEGMAGECIWGCACWVVVPYDELRGDKLPPPNRKVILEQGIAAMTRTVVPTPGGAPVKRLASDGTPAKQLGAPAEA
ncbi:tubulin-like doman-containing protein [Hyphomicrobium sp. MC1]|uniref:tubulin-like doman-containing protein n=2 Tax=unclassified Hyphomicrobium TaxID=2619925 RepID=UPI00045E6316|nr:tubulin-like doman-containing protein [Hyphomicrobium sp. MC1]